MESLKGKLLIATPELDDPNFRRAVVLLAMHDEEGAMGVVLNRPGALTLAQLLDGIPHSDSRPRPEGGSTFIGGPVQPQLVTVLHGVEEAAGGEVVEGVRVSNDIEALDAALQRASFLESPVDTVLRLYCGYSGWGAGQLESELSTGSWLTLDAREEHIFETPPGFLWARSLRELGGPYRGYGLQPNDPQDN